MHLIQTDGLIDSPETRSLEPIVSLSAIVDRMRLDDDPKSGTVNALETIITNLQAIDFASHRARLLGVLAPDILYQSICHLTMLDRFTRLYIQAAVRHYFSEIREAGICSFYVLDNELRDDRFAAFVELFDLAGFSVTSPHVQGLEWVGLEARIRADLAERRCIAYVEKDATVNHLDSVKALAAASGYAAAFRNLAPETPEVEILGLPSGDDSGAIAIHIFDPTLSPEERQERIRKHHGTSRDATKK